MAVTGGSRDHARRRLARPRGHGRPKAASAAPAAEVFEDALRALRRVWAFSGGECGKYLAASMGVLLAALDGYGDLVVGVARSSAAVRTEVLAMSPATIDRHLVPARARDQLLGQATTKPSPLLRLDQGPGGRGGGGGEPGFFECDTVAHCGPNLKVSSPGR